LPPATKELEDRRYKVYVRVKMFANQCMSGLDCHCIGTFVPFCDAPKFLYGNHSMSKLLSTCCADDSDFLPI
jgi:hypothetical protein